MSQPQPTESENSMEREANPYQTPVDAVVVESPRPCPECGGDMEQGFVRTYFLQWDNGRRPWWRIFLSRYERLMRLPFVQIFLPKVPSHLCRRCHVVVMELEKHAN